MNTPAYQRLEALQYFSIQIIMCVHGALYLLCFAHCPHNQIASWANIPGASITMCDAAKARANAAGAQGKYDRAVTEHVPASKDISLVVNPYCCKKGEDGYEENESANSHHYYWCDKCADDKKKPRYPRTTSE
ncbi:hypothetical protein B0T24DRAFT_591807 [Lasiosphaeria ovina]|uniref:Uncharacterized protein n=1 Tax=Lasiosphaeria ovina TaxID=92902 RepID=A0AAE0NB53_9PEZI|nr:hypothetical protein B0T24DRAFT_591807 [Lasiosphaeria ovina]